MRVLESFTILQSRSDWQNEPHEVAVANRTAPLVYLSFLHFLTEELTFFLATQLDS